ncbi:MAG: formate dehydrogenase accessory protein FdhE [Acidobacteria bacterium]|nr:formate dehydrogenase accessory protein FdhE [Acidobacteriota bacterium]
MPDPLGPLSTGILAEAERRWDLLTAADPSLRRAVDLQRGLIGRSVQLFETIRTTGVRAWPFNLDVGRLRSKLERGVPLLRDESWTLPVGPLTDALLDFCRMLEVSGAGASAAHISQAIDSKRLDAGSLLNASLARADCDIRDGAIQLGLAPDLLWLTAELAVSPYAYFLQRSLAASLPPDVLSTWDRGDCPFCGSWPALAERLVDRRVLRCSLCAAAWPAHGGCIYCHEHGDAFSSAAIDRARPERLLETCGACGGYLKALVSDRPLDFPLAAVEDLATGDLDAAAAARGFRRPALRKLLSAQTPRPS